MWSLGVRFRETPLTTRVRAASRFRCPRRRPLPSSQLSPDGRYLAITAAEGSRRRLWVRPLDALDAQVLSGTDDATYPFWSPDSAFIAFFAQGKLKKIAVAGGPPQILCDAPKGRGGTWSTEGVILFASLGSRPISRAGDGRYSRSCDDTRKAGEGPSIPRVSPGRHAFPVFGRVVATADSNGIYVGSREGPPPVRLLPDESSAVYVPPEVSGTSGLLLFRRSDGTLMAQPFDAGRLTLDGRDVSARRTKSASPETQATGRSRCRRTACWPTVRPLARTSWSSRGRTGRASASASPASPVGFGVAALCTR